MADAMTEEEILSLVQHEFENAMGHPEGEIALERGKAIEMYESKPLGNEVDGQSSFVVSDVADAVEGVLPSLLRIFTTQDNLVEFIPEGPEDAQAARQQSDYVSWIFFQQNPAFLILYTWFFDALLQKNGIVKAFWDEREIVTRESYEGLTDEGLDALLADDELELVEQEDREGQVPEQVVVGGELREVLRDSTVHDVVFRRTTTEGRVVIVNVPPEEFRISQDATSVDPSTARMVGQERDIPRSELLEMGISREIVEELPASGEGTESGEEARRKKLEEQETGGTPDKSQQKVKCREVYLRADLDGDGRSRLYYLLTAASKILDREEIDRQPFHVLSPQPLPHKHFGRSWADKVTDIHELRTTLVRQMLDNLYQTNNPELGVWEQALSDNSLDDLMTRQAGGYKRFNRPVQESFAPISVPFTAGASLPFLELVEQMKRERTGVSNDSQGLTADALKNIQTSVLSQALEMGRMKIEAVVRIFAETGIRSLFLHIHELVLKHQRRGQTVELRNEWVHVDPREWRTRRNVTVKIGLGLGTREQNLIHLDAILARQKEIADAGGMGLLLDPKHVYNALAALVRNASAGDPREFFKDPGDAPFQAQDNQVTQLQEQVAQLQAQLQAREQDIDRERNMLQHQRELAKIELDRQKQSQDLAVELEKIRNALTELELEHGQDVPGSKV